MRVKFFYLTQLLTVVFFVALLLTGFNKWLLAASMFCLSYAIIESANLRRFSRKMLRFKNIFGEKVTIWFMRLIGVFMFGISLMAVFV